MIDRTRHEANRLSWNAATEAHNTHKGDQARFFREGGSTLTPIELGLLGDLRDQRVVHLQCNAGQDTLSLVRLGARALGVDISDVAVDFARRLSGDSGLFARFERTDVFDFLATTEERFELAFSSYGAIGWLSDLDGWARGISRILAPGGRLLLVEFHPIWFCLDEAWQPRSPYAAASPIDDPEGVGDYVAGFHRAGEAIAPLEGAVDFVNPHACHEFAWSLGDLMGAVLRAGLTLTRFEEYDWSPYPLVPDMRRDEAGRWRPPEGVSNLPLVYALEARR